LGDAHHSASGGRFFFGLAVYSISWRIRSVLAPAKPRLSVSARRSFSFENCAYIRDVLFGNGFNNLFAYSGRTRAASGKTWTGLRSGRGMRGSASLSSAAMYFVNPLDVTVPFQDSRLEHPRRL